MVKAIIGTIGSRFGIMLLTFVVVMLNTNLLGAEGQGTAALINLGIMILVAFSNYVGGGAVVYLTPRYAPNQLWAPAISWSVLSAVAFYLINQFIPGVPHAYLLHVSILGLMQSLLMFNLQVLMGKQKIKYYNTCVMMQAVFLLLPIAIMYTYPSFRSIETYIIGLYSSFGLTYVLSFFYTARFMSRPSFEAFIPHFKAMFHYGKFSQTGVLLQLMNYRLNFFLLEYLLPQGRAQVGIYSIGLHVSEAVWNIGKSLSIVQYAKLSNEEDKDYGRTLSLSFFKISFLVSFPILLVILFVPDSVYTFVFGKTIYGLQNLILLLAAGIMANSSAMIFSHHFSGKGKHHLNSITSALGLVVTLILGFLLIPKMGVQGAAITASSTYCFQLIFSGVIFMRMEMIHPKDLFISRADLKKVKELFSQKISAN